MDMDNIDKQKDDFRKYQNLRISTIGVHKLRSQTTFTNFCLSLTTYPPNGLSKTTSSRSHNPVKILRCT